MLNFNMFSCFVFCCFFNELFENENFVDIFYGGGGGGGGGAQPQGWIILGLFF